MNKVLKKITICFLLGCFIFATAQEKRNINEQLLYNFIEKKEGKADWIFVRGLTNSYDYPLINNQFILKDGVYFFFKPSPHSFYYIFSYSQNKISIVSDLGADSLLALYEKEKVKCKDTKSRLLLLEKMVKILAHNESLMKDN